MFEGMKIAILNSPGCMSDDDSMKSKCKSNALSGGSNFFLLPRLGEAGWGLYWYDFGARMFDEQLGRWHVPDPMNQYISPYVGMGNRPSSMVDPDGMWAWGQSRKTRNYFDEWAAYKACSDRQMEWNSYISSFSAAGSNKLRESVNIFLLTGIDEGTRPGGGVTFLTQDEALELIIDGGTQEERNKVKRLIENNGDMNNLWKDGNMPFIKIVSKGENIRDGVSLDLDGSFTGDADGAAFTGRIDVVDPNTMASITKSIIYLSPMAFDSDRLMSLEANLHHELNHALQYEDGRLGSFKDWASSVASSEIDIANLTLYKSEISAWQATADYYRFSNSAIYDRANTLISGYQNDIDIILKKYK